MSPNQQLPSIAQDPVFKPFAMRWRLGEQDFEFASSINSNTPAHIDFIIHCPGVNCKWEIEILCGDFQIYLLSGVRGGIPEPTGSPRALLLDDGGLNTAHPVGEFGDREAGGVGHTVVLVGVGRELTGGRVSDGEEEERQASTRGGNLGAHYPLIAIRRNNGAKEGDDNEHRARRTQVGWRPSRTTTKPCAHWRAELASLFHRITIIKLAFRHRLGSLLCCTLFRSALCLTVVDCFLGRNLQTIPLTRPT